MTTKDIHLVMIVDDDEAIRETLRDIIEDQGYHVVCCENGQAALATLLGQGEAPCMILLDLMMPVMDGWSFRREQLSDPRVADIPIVVITASEETNGTFADVPILKKPLEYDAVIRAVSERC